MPAKRKAASPKETSTATIGFAAKLVAGKGDYYETKGLASEAGSVFGVKFKDQMMRWLRGKDSDALVTALREAIPEIPAVAR